MSESTSRAVFLSYASQDAEAARRICEALRAVGIEVWFDQSELRGGDAWDQKIRKQIKDCALFVPLISANTQTRHEGYFRLEWHLAEQRSHLIARGRPFIVPVAIDDTRDTDALVPDAFLAVQWMRLAGGGYTMEAFSERLVALLAGKPAAGVADPGPASTMPVTTKPTRARPRHLGWLAGAVLVLAGAAALFLVRPSAVFGPATPASASGQPELSETDKLVARATAILDGSALSPEEIGTANDLVAQAIERDPSNAAAWTTAARADLMMIHPYGYDRSETRRQQAMSRATRALNLAPDAFATRVMHTAVMAHASGNPDLTREAEETFRRLIKEHPGNIDLQVRLAEVLREQERFAEAAAVFESIAEFELAAWSWFQAGRIAAAYDQVKRAVVARRTTSALNLKSRIESDWIQDLAASAATIAEFRPSELREELSAASAVRIAFLRREPERMLQIVNALSHDFMDSHAYVGPRQFWTGWAHHLAGRSERAAIEWRKGIPILQAERAKAPDRVALFVREAELHALLGDIDEAARLLDTAQRIANERAEVVNGDNHRVYLALGHREQVLAWLTSLLREKTDPSWYLIHALARFSPEWDGLRGDPRFEALLRETMPPGAKPFDDPKPAATTTAVEDKSVAVLAFASQSIDKENEYFSDGISEELTHVLGRVPGLKVAAPSSAFHFKGKDTPPREIARQLGVAYLVTGSVGRQGNQVRIRAQLHNAADDVLVWASEPLTRELQDIFALQDEIAGLIAQNLQMKLGVVVGAARGAVNPEAHRLVLEGLAQWNQRTYASIERAETLFTRALALDPNFAAAHAGLAQVSTVRRTFLQQEGLEDKQDDAGRAEAEALRAIALDPTLAEAHTSLGFTYVTSRRWEEAERSFQQAVASNPNYAVVYLQQASLYHARGQFREALRSIDRGLELDPLSFVGQWDPLESTCRHASLSIL